MLATFGVWEYANDKMGLGEREFGLSELEALAVLYRVRTKKSLRKRKDARDVEAVEQTVDVYPDGAHLSDENGAMSVDERKGMRLFQRLCDIVLYLFRSEPCGFEPVLCGL